MSWTTNQKREFANSLTHGFGVLLCVIALPILLQQIASKGGAFDIFSAAIYAFSLLFVYTTSTLYHSISFPPVKRKLRLLDHISIYFFIAGSYTPFLVILLKFDSPFLFALMWIMVAVGIIFKLVFPPGKMENLSTITYVAMGWIGLVKVFDLWEQLPVFSSVLLIAGGLSYTFGVLFYMRDHLGYNHAIWHIFVILGSVAHFAALMFGINYPLSV